MFISGIKNSSAWTEKSHYTGCFPGLLLNEADYLR